MSPYYPPSGGSGSSNSGGLAGTGGLFVVTSASPLLPNSRILTAGSSVTTVTDSTAIYVTALTSFNKDVSYYRQLVATTPGVSNQALYPNGTITQTLLGADNILSVGSIYFAPFVMIKSMRIDTMGINIQTASNGLVNFGIYTNSADSVPYPMTAVVTSGVIGGSAGFTAIGVNHVLSANNLYWVAILCTTAPSSFRSVHQAHIPNVLGWGSGGFSVRAGYITGVASAFLPSSISGTALNAYPQNTMPTLFMRASL